jgi:CRISPR-associated protein Csm3
MKKMIGCGKLTGTIHVQGLRIGGPPPGLEIGGAVDLNALRDPLTHQPYIPGSSLKGRLRATLEREAGKSSQGGGPCDCRSWECPICQIFGAHHTGGAQKGSGAPPLPTRIVVRDAHLTAESAARFKELAAESKSFFEEKAEYLVRRDSGEARDPRWQERVWEADFHMEILLHVYTDDNPEEMMKLLRHGLGLIQETGSLGAGGSRGSGQVSFRVQEEWLKLAEITV